MKGYCSSSVSMCKRIIFIVFLLLYGAKMAVAQYNMENLNRGVIAVSTGGSNVFVSWRWLGTENDITFNLYRNGTKINASPLTVCNYTDNSGSTSASYTVKAIINGVEQTASEAAKPWAQQYLKIPMNVPPAGKTPSGEAYTYSPNDCSVGDIDGDGVYEIFVKWDPSNSKDNSLSGYTGNVYIDCYTIKGTFLWRIDLGKNIRAGAHYTQFLVYDFDGDGKAEMACKTGDGTKDGKGVVIGNGSADYRNSKGYILTGPEYLTIFNGQTGAAMSTVNYTPARGTVSSWGDSYGNRVDRFIAAVVYLDGVHPSMVFGRGYYTRLVRSAWDFKGGKLVQRWIFDSNNSGSTAYKGQGNHQMTVGDMDGDGKQEFCNGSSVIDDSGVGLYTTGHGHGDALHMSDMDPDKPGLEIWQNNEEPAHYGNYALELKEAKTGKNIFAPLSGNQGDIGRSMAADIDPRYKGYEMWGAGKTYSCKGQLISNSRPSECFGVYWDGDLQRELLDGILLEKWDYLNSKRISIETFSAPSWGSGASCNTTKATPNLACDLLGDWREEIILHSTDNKNLLVYTTTIPSTYKFRTLMHDPQYRVAISWQNSAYNQPPHLGYYLGSDMATPAKPNIVLIGKLIVPDPPVVAKKYIYTYDNSGNLSWSNANSWAPKAVPTDIDTVIIRSGEVQIGALDHKAPVYVEANGTLRLIDNATISDLRLQGGTLKVYTSSPQFDLTAAITVEKPSTIMAGSVAATVFALNGTISGSANLTKTSVGNLRINSTATGFKGNWIINEGKLQLRSATGLGVCGVQVKTGARLDIEVAGASIYSLIIDSGGGVDLDQNLNTNVAVFGTENILTGAYKNTNYPSYIGSTAALNVSNSLVVLSGPAALCTGSSLTATASSGASYIWKNNTTQVGTTATYTTSAAGSYTVDATNAAGCKVSSAPVITTIVALPAATITSPATSFCTGGSVVLSANTGTGLIYQWSNAAGTISGATSATYTTTAAGAYSVKVTNASGCKATSAVTQITANALPTATITSPATSFCTGGSVILTASTGSSYKWFNGTTQVGTAATYTATAAGSYTVEVTNASGCKATSAVTQITVNTLPTATITSASNSFCTGGSVLLTSSTGSSYKWFNGTIQVGTAATYSATSAGSYTVEVTNAAGCKATSPVMQITVNTLPSASITSASSSFCTGGSALLTSSTGASYKWFNGTAQVGTAATYNATVAGAYTVEVTNASGCKATSAVTQITVTSGTVWYADTDKDGKGDPAISQTACTQPAGYVSVAGDACPLDANKTTSGSCGCGKLETDTDGDGTADCIDNDDDNDGVTDANDCQPLNAAVTGTTNWYSDADGDGKGDPSSSLFACAQPAGYVSTAGDTCPLDANKTTPGDCGCGKIETDTDGDGSADCIDNDDDNDGVADANDCQPLNTAVTAAANWYQDTDGDGKGDPSSSLYACTQPAGYVATADDTCPSDPEKSTPGNCGCGNKEACLDCAGTPNGTAVIDNCNICTGGTTGKTACVTTATVNGTTANISVTPQPFDNTTTIKLENNGNIQSITIISAGGALVDYKSGINTTELLVGEELIAGLYTVIIQTEKGVYTTKIVKK